MAKPNLTKVTVELTIDDLEYFWEALHSHHVLHERLVENADSMPWQTRLKVVKDSYDGRARAQRTMDNLRAMINNLEAGKETEGASLVAPPPEAE